MAYTAPNITATGLSIPSYTDILNNLLTIYQSIYGSSVYLGTDSSDYQFISALSLSTSDTDNAMQGVYSSFNPLTAIGTSLDLLGQLIGTARKTATYSQATLTVTGTAGTVITNGVAQDQNGNYWTLSTPVTISNGGVAYPTATCQTIGNITAAPNTITIISTTTLGWISVTNAASAIAGQAVESDSQYRARLIISQALPSLTEVAGTAAAIAQISGVRRSQVFENPTNSADANGNPPHSITCVVEGGAAQSIAQAIYNNKGIGCYTNGTTTISITDASNGSLSQNISFIVLGYVTVYVAYNVHVLSGYTSSTTTAIEDGCFNYLNELNIGEDVLYSQLFAATQAAAGTATAPTFAIRSIAYGSLAAATTGILNSTTSVTVTSGAGIVMGQVVVGAGILPNTTVSTVVGTAVTLSQAATATTSGVPLSFFTLNSAGTDVVIPFSSAALGLYSNIVVNLVS